MAQIRENNLKIAYKATGTRMTCFMHYLPLAAHSSCSLMQCNVGTTARACAVPLTYIWMQAIILDRY
jgi:hypothetical protein